MKLHLNDSFDLSTIHGNSGMEIFKISKLFYLDEKSNKNVSEKINFELVDEIGSGICNVACSYSSSGSCNYSTMLCGSSDGICKLSEINNDSRFNMNFPTINLLSYFDSYYELKYNFLDITEVGKKFINYYYSISEFVDINDLTISDFGSLVDILPDLNIAVDKINSNEDGVVITEVLRSKASGLIEILKQKSNDSNYQKILDDLSSEISLLSGKTKTEMTNEMVEIQ
ncbi:MAG: hypothetical protein HRT70_05780 [Flavobacteriaceae bacterium]|nr:hypothetical protein [Flavobacteriaceae bacterium]